MATAVVDAWDGSDATQAARPFLRWSVARLCPIAVNTTERRVLGKLLARL